MKEWLSGSLAELREWLSRRRSIPEKLAETERGIDALTETEGAQNGTPRVAGLGRLISKVIKPPVSTLDSFPPYHPNCRTRIVTLDPDRRSR